MDILTDEQILTLLLEANLFSGLYSHRFNLQLQILLQFPRNILIAEKYLEIPRTGKLYRLYRNFSRKYYSVKASEYFSLEKCLEIAAKNGLKTEIEVLVEEGLYDFTQGIEYAAEGGHLEIVQFLMQDPTKIMSNDDNGYLERGMGLAAGNGHREVIQFFRSKISDPSIVFIVAARNSSLEVFKSFLPRTLISQLYPGEEIELIFPDTILTDHNIKAAIYFAGWGGNLPIINLLFPLIEGSCENFLEGLLRFEVEWQSPERIQNYQLLIDQYIDMFPSLSINSQRDILDHAIRNHNFNLIRRCITFYSSNLDAFRSLLFQRQIGNTSYGQSLFDLAAENGTLEIFILLLEFGESNDWKSILERTVRGNQIEIVDYILTTKPGLSVYIRLLDIAANRGYLEVLQLLLQRAECLNVNIIQQLAISAATRGHKPIVDFIIDLANNLEPTSIIGLRIRNLIEGPMSLDYNAIMIAAGSYDHDHYYDQLQVHRCQIIDQMITLGATDLKNTFKKALNSGNIKVIKMFLNRQYPDVYLDFAIEDDRPRFFHRRSFECLLQSNQKNKLVRNTHDLIDWFRLGPNSIELLSRFEN